MRRHILYAITAQVMTTGEHGETGSRQVPTFYLDSGVQGILTVEHANEIAKGIIDPMGTLTVSIHAEPVPVTVAV